MLNTIIIIEVVIIFILLLIALKGSLWPFNSSKEQIRDTCRQIDLGFDHYTTGIVAEEITSGTDRIKKTYQFRCPTTHSSGWVTGVKTGGVVLKFGCCGKFYATFTEPQLENVLGIHDDEGQE